MKKVHSDGPAEVVGLGKRGFYGISLPLAENWDAVEAFLRKYKNRPISLADACLIRCAELHNEARILTFDSDFKIYRWGRNNKFEILSVSP
jgi:predicted nucleic acid-binding protein